MNDDLLGEGGLEPTPAFCGTLAGIGEITDSPAGCLLRVLAARGAIEREVRP